MGKTNQNARYNAASRCQKQKNSVTIWQNQQRETTPTPRQSRVEIYRLYPSCWQKTLACGQRARAHLSQFFLAYNPI